MGAALYPQDARTASELRGDELRRHCHVRSQNHELRPFSRYLQAMDNFTLRYAGAASEFANALQQHEVTLCIPAQGAARRRCPDRTGGIAASLDLIPRAAKCRLWNSSILSKAPSSSTASTLLYSRYTVVTQQMALWIAAGLWRLGIGQHQRQQPAGQQFH